MNSRHSFRALLLAAAASIAPNASQAATLYWDGGATTVNTQSDNATTTGQNWLSGGNWDNGTTSAALASWAAGDNAVFGGTAASQTITAGTLTIGNMTFGSGALGAGTSGTAYTVTGGTITLSSTTITTNTNTTISSVLAGSSTLTKAGAGTLSLNAANSFTGNITVSAGLLDVLGTFNNSNPTTSSLGNMTTAGRTVTVNSGATLRFSGSDAIGQYNYKTAVTLIADGGTITRASGTTTFNSIGDVQLKNGGRLTTTNGSASTVGSFAINGNVTVSGTSGSFIDTLSGQTTNSYINLGTVTGSTTFDVAATGDATADLTISAVLGDKVLSGAAGLVKTGAGSMVLSSGANTFTGNVTISGGKVSVTAASTTAQSGSPTNSGLGNMTTAGRTITVGSGATLEIVASDALGAYNYTTPVTLIIDGGTLTRNLAAANTKGNFSSLGNITLRNGGRIVTTNGNAAIGSLVGCFAINGNVTVDGSSVTGAVISPEATQTYQNYIDIGGTTGSTLFTVGETNNAATADLTVSTVLADRVLGGAATLVKAGAGRMVLSGSNVYSGGTTLRAGVLVAGSSNAFGTSGTITVNDASTSTSDTSLLIDATSGGVTVSRNITVANQGSGTVTLGSATTANSNQAIFSGAITLNKATTLTGGAAGDRMGFTGGIGGTANVTIAGTNRVLFSGTANTYAGTTTINSGAILQLSDGTGTANSFLADGSDVTVTGTLRLAKGGNSETIAGLNGAGTVSAISGSDTLIVGSGNANGSFSGALNNGGATLAFTKTGTGTQTLTGTSNYTGATTVSNGTLALGTGGALGSTAVTIASGATLTTAAGTTAGGSVTVNSGGTLTAAGTISGAVSVAGTATLSGALASTLGVTGTATVASGGSVAGITTLTSGTLTANGTLGTVNVASGATLGGSGSAGTVNVATGTANLIAGNGTSGTLTMSSLTFAGTGSLTIGALSNYTSSAAFSVTGALAQTSQTTPISIVLPVGVVANGIYKLISFGTTTLDDTKFSVTGPSVGNRQSAILSKDAVNNVFLYTVSGFTPVWTGANSSVFSGGSNWVKSSDANAVVDYAANDTLLVDDTATRTTVDISGADVTPTALTFDNSSKNFTLQGSNGLSSGALVKTGSGILYVNNANSMTTGSFSAGSVVLGNAGALGTATVTLSGTSVLDLNGQSTSAAIVLSGGSIANAGTINGQVSGTGALNKATTGTLTLKQQNNFSGGTTVSNGVLALGHATNTLADGGAVTVSGGELSLGSNSDTVGALTLTGGSITGTGALTASSLDLQAGIVSAKLAGSGAATKNGAGTVTLSAANTGYSGTVTVSAGTISVGDDAALGTGTVNLNGGDIALSGQTISNTVSFGGGSISGSGTFSGSITGSSAFTKSGSGTLTISGNKTIASGISVTGGTLSVTAGNLNSGAYAGNIATSGTGTFALTGNFNQTLSGVISGTGSLTKSGNGTLTLSGGSSSLTGDVSITGGKVSVTGFSATSQGGSPTVSALGNMTVSRTITVGSGATLEIVASDAIGAYNYLTPVTLVADGGTISAGLAAVGVKGNFRSIGNLTLRNGGALVTANGNAALATLVGSFAINGNVTVDGASVTGATISPEATQTFQNYINLGTVNGGTTFTVAETNDATTADLTVSTILANKVLGGTATLTKAGLGRMVLTAANAYTGSTTISGGTLAISGGGGIYRGVGYAGTSLTIASGAALEVESWHYNESSSSLGGLSANASSLVVNGGTIRVTGATATTYGRGVTVNSGGVTLEAATGANWTIDTVNDTNAWVYNGNPSVTLGGAGTGTFQKVLGLGTGGISKTGAGTWTLSGTNTYSGGTVISGGTLRAANASAFGSGSVTVSTGGTLDVNGNTLTNAITASGGSIAGAGTLSGVISGSGSISKSSNDTLLISNVNSYQGGTSLSGGTITVGNDSALGSGDVTLSGGTLDINGRSLTNKITLSGGAVSGAGTLSGILSGTGGLTKSSAGVLTLAAANTYSGATSVNNGTLALSSTGSLAAESAVAVASGATLTVASGARVNGSTSLASGATLTANGTLADVSVASGATLSGSGTFGAVTVADGSATLTAGTSGSGTLTLASLSFDGTAVLNIGSLANYTSAPAFAVTGALSQTSVLTPISLSLPSGIVSNGTYQLISFGSTSLDVANFSISGPVLGGRQVGSLVKSGSLFQYVVSGTSPKWTGRNSTAFSGGGNWTIIDGDGSDNDYIANDLLLVDDTATGTTLDISGANVAPTAINFANSTKDFTLQGTNGIAGGTLAKSGTGNLTIANANSIASASITAGTVTLAGTGALDGTAVTLSGGTLDLNGQTTSASVALAGGALAGSGTVSGVISGSTGLSKSTAGTLTLSGTNTYTGGTSVSNGVLALGNATNTLADNQAVTVSGGELALGANSDTVGAVTLTGGSITGSGTLTGSSYALQAGTVSAKLGGSASVAKTGAGTVTLNAANTYSGGTSVSNGVLALGDDSALGSGSVALSGGTLQLSGQTVTNNIAFTGGSVSGSGTLSGAMSGASAFTKSGSGTLFLAGNQTLGAGVVVSGGALAFTGTLGGGTYAGNFSGSGTLGFLSTSNQVLSGGASTFTGDILIEGAKVSVTVASATAQGANPTNSGLGNMTTAGRVIAVSGSGSVLEFAVADAIGAFGYNNSNLMLVARNGGVITRTSGAFNSIGSITLDNGGILRANNGQNGTVNSMSINGNVTVTGTIAGGTIESVGVSNAGIHLHSTGSSGNVTFDVDDTAAAVDLLVTASLLNPVQVNYLGYNSSGKTAGIIKAGTGTMSLTAANSYTGGTTINAGVLSVGNAGALGSAAVTLNGGSLELGGVTLTNAITAAGGSITGSGTISGNITGSVGLSISSSSSLVLNGSNNFTGGLTLNGGSLSGNGAGAFGNGSIIVNGGSIDLGGYSIASAVTLTGGALTGASGLSGTLGFSNVTLAYSSLTSFGTAAITVGSGATLDLNDLNPTNAVTLAGGTLRNYGSWSGGVTLAASADATLINSLSLNEVTVKSGATVDLAGVSKDIVYQGGTLNNLGSYAGTLTVRGSLNLSSGTPATSSTILVAAGGAVDFGGNDFAGNVLYTGGTVANYAGDVKVQGTGVALAAGSLGSANLVIGAGASASIGSGFSSAIRLDGGEIAGDTLNNFSGTVTVAAGKTFDIDGADSTAVINSGASVVLESGATLKGSGTVGQVTVSGGILSPGNSPGLLTTSGLALTAGSMKLEIASVFPGDGSAAVAGTDYDSVNVAGTLDLTQLSPGSRFVLNLVTYLQDGTTPGAPGSWDPSTDFSLAIFSYGYLDLGGNTDIDRLFAIDTKDFLDASGSQVESWHFRVVDNAGTQQVLLTYSSIPEPSTYGAILGGLALAAAAIRRRRKQASK